MVGHSPCFIGLNFPLFHWLGCNGCFLLAHLWLFLIGWTVAVSHWLDNLCVSQAEIPCFSLAGLWLFPIGLTASHRLGWPIFHCAVTASHWWLLLDKKKKNHHFSAGL